MKAQKIAALSWWHQRFSSIFNNIDRALSENSLQEVFSLRRKIEIAIATGNSPSPSTLQDWLVKLEKLYKDLDKIRDEASRIYGTEELSLTIESLSQSWQQKNVNVEVRIGSSDYLDKGEITLNYVILCLLHELFRLSSQTAKLTEIYIRLDSQSSRTDLKIRISKPDFDAQAMSNPGLNNLELGYLQTVFPLLTGGQCQRQENRKNSVWNFQWDTHAAQ